MIKSEYKNKIIGFELIRKESSKASQKDEQLQTDIEKDNLNLIKTQKNIKLSANIVDLKIGS